MYRDFDNFEERTFKVKKKKTRKRTAGNVVTTVEVTRDTWQ